MARRVPILIAVLIAIALCYFGFRRRDVGEGGQGNAPAPTTATPAAASLAQVREPVPGDAEREPASAPATAELSRTVLAVRVVAKESGSPLAGIRLTVFQKDPKPGTSSRDVDGNRGAIETAPRTDPEGRAEFELPSGVDLTISARAEDDAASTAYLDVPALESGKRRELTIELLTRNDVVFHGRVLAREDRHPIQAATVYVENPGGRIEIRDGELRPGPSITTPRDEITDVDGRFELELSSWMAPWASISARGFATALLAPTSGHETRESEQEIVLDHAAELRIHLIDARGLPLTEARVRAGTESYHVQQPEGASLTSLLSVPDPNWSADTDADGRCTLNALPPNAPLHVEASRGGKSLGKKGDPITLHPGEVREIEWRIGGGCRLEGRVTDSKNAPVMNQDLWVLGLESEAAEYLASYAERRVIARAKTDGDGRYHVDDLSAGGLLIGPAPARTMHDSPRDDAIAPLAVVVEIPEGVSEIERDLVVYRGLYIRGHVFDSAGAPASGAGVMATTDGTTVHTVAQAADDGAFALGPLAPGSFRLQSLGFRKYAASDIVMASAGDEGVVLRCASAVSVFGSVVDEQTGLACEAKVTVGSRDPSNAILMTGSTKSDGSFKFDGLSPGSYDVSASTGDGKSGSLRSIVVAAGSTSGDLVVRVKPGAKVIVRYEGKTMWGHFELESGGVLLGGDGLQTGTRSVRAVPAGHVVVRFHRRNSTRTQERELDLAVGEEKEAVFGDGD